MASEIHRLKLIFLLVPILVTIAWGNTPRSWFPGRHIEFSALCDFPGRTIGQQFLSFNLCEKACLDNAYCTHYVWRNEKGGMCQLKDSSCVLKKDAVQFRGNGFSFCAIMKRTQACSDCRRNTASCTQCCNGSPVRTPVPSQQICDCSSTNVDITKCPQCEQNLLEDAQNPRDCSRCRRNSRICPPGC